jgi:hypothetical protein
MLLALNNNSIDKKNNIKNNLLIISAILHKPLQIKLKNIWNKEK